MGEYAESTVYAKKCSIEEPVAWISFPTDIRRKLSSFNKLQVYFGVSTLLDAASSDNQKADEEQKEVKLPLP